MLRDSIMLCFKSLTLLLLGACNFVVPELETNFSQPPASPPPSALSPIPSSTYTPISSEGLPFSSPTVTSTPTMTKTIPLSNHGPITIGFSVSGRPLEVFRFGEGPKKRLIVAGMHGGYEWNTIALADQLITILRGRPDWIPDDMTLYILRSLNPDGETRAQGIHGRTNDHGVDLNRNWPTLWQASWPIDGCWRYLPVTAGAYPASEPETRALMQFLLEQEVQALINYHSAALGIFPGGQPPDQASISLADAIASISDYPYPPIDTGCQFTGQLIDWASQQGIAAVDIELTNHRDTDLRQNLEILNLFLHWQP